MNKYLKISAAGCVFILTLVFIFTLLIPASSEATSNNSDATLTINVTYFSNYSSSSASHPANMSNNVYVGSSQAPFGAGTVVIPLTSNGLSIIDQNSSDAVNWPGLHVTRQNGYVRIANDSYNDEYSYMSVEANYSLANATITNVQNDPTHPLDFGALNATCGIIQGDANHLGQDAYSFSGNSGTICSTTNPDSDIIEVYYTYQPSVVCNPNTTQKCVGNAVYNFDSCGAQGGLVQQCTTAQTCLNAQCVTQTIACSSDSDCGTDIYTGSPFCQGNSVYQNFKTYTCSNPGTASSSCSNSTAQQKKNDCTSSQICADGSCKAQTIACSSNSDCGTDIYTGSPFCQGGNVYQLFKTYTCTNPGTSSSTCSNSSDAKKKNDCSSTQTCSDGSCVTNQTGINVSCYSAPNPATQNQTVSFICNTSGGNGTFTYSWTGACTGSASVCTTQFPNPGTYTANVQVTSGSQTNSTTASVVVNGPVYIPPVNYCSQNASQRCNGNYLSWYDSCGNQQGNSQYCPNGCIGNTCQTYNYINTNYIPAPINYNNNYLTVTKTVRNLSNGSSFSNSTTANPGDILMFMITLQSNGNTAQNVFVRDNLPANLIYNNNLVVACSSANNNYNNSYNNNNNCGNGNYNYSGNISSGINLNSIYPGQTATITYQVQVAPDSSFPYGTTTLNNSASVTSSNGSTPTASASVTVTRTQVYGASSVSTGLTNNFLTDSFFLPLALALLALAMWKSGLFFGIEKWFQNKKRSKQNFKSEKELKDRIAEIQNSEGY